MTERTGDDRRRLAALEGRVAFGMAAFAVVGALVALVDRVGAPERIVVSLGPITLAAALVLVGALVRALRLSSFYAAGRAAPAAYAGLATAGVAAGLVASLLVTPLGERVSADALACVAVGVAGAAFLVGPLLRKTGAYSPTDLLALRFPSRWVRLAAAACVAAASTLAALAAYEAAVRLAQDTLAVSRPAAALLVAGVVLAIAAPGGAAGVVWGSVAAAGVLVAALGLLAALVLWTSGALPLPGVGGRETWVEATMRLAQWRPEGAQPLEPLGVTAMAVFAIGLACLAPLLTGSIAARDTRAARRSGFAALAWSGALAAGVAGAVAASAVAAPDLLVGLRPENLPAFVYDLAGRGLATICGAPAGAPRAALAACDATAGFGGRLTDSHLWISTRALLTGAAQWRGLPAALSGALAAGLMGVALMACAAGVQAAATAIGHDALMHARRAGSYASVRLAATRLWMVGLLAALAATEAGVRLDPLLLIAGAAA
ncbi:MAG TPA: symporter-like protein, partial [Beijerinckiaceae bacterium]